MKQEKTKFKDLSWPIKIAIIYAWIRMGYSALLFILGFVLGIASGLFGL